MSIYEEGNLNTEIQIHKRMPCEHKGRNWNYASTRQEMAKIASSHRKLEERFLLCQSWETNTLTIRILAKEVSDM